MGHDEVGSNLEVPFDDYFTYLRYVTIMLYCYGRVLLMDVGS